MIATSAPRRRPFSLRMTFLRMASKQGTSLRMASRQGPLPFAVPTALLLALCAPVSAAMGIRADGHLDMPALRQAYQAGQGPEVRVSLDGFLKHHPKDVSLDEKMFTHLFLGILCAADTAAIARAESHFNALLRLSPGAGPDGLSVPPATLAIFERVKRDFQERSAQSTAPGAVSTAPAVAPVAAAKPVAAVILLSAPMPEAEKIPPVANPVLPNPAEPKSGAAASGGTTAASGAGRAPAVAAADGHAWVWWTVGSAAVAAGVGVYAVAASDAKPSPNRKEVDATLK